jgi:hypothetical protein
MRKNISNVPRHLSHPQLTFKSKSRSVPKEKNEKGTLVTFPDTSPTFNLPSSPSPGALFKKNMRKNASNVPRHLSNPQFTFKSKSRSVPKEKNEKER